MAPQRSADVLSSVLTCKKATDVLEKIYALNKICSDTIMCFRKKHTVNKVIYWSVDERAVTKDLQGPNPVFLQDQQLCIC